MAQIDDLRRQAEIQAARAAQAQPTQVVLVPQKGPVDDLETALDLLRQSHIMLGLISDPQLVRVVSQRERAIMVKLGDRISEFVGEVKSAMEFEGVPF